MLDKLQHLQRQPSLDQFAYSPRQWARVVGIHPATVYRQIRAGLLPAKQTPSGMKILREDGLQSLRELPDVVPVRDHEAA